MKFDPVLVGLETEGMTMEQVGAYFTAVKHLWQFGPLAEDRLRRICNGSFEAVRTRMVAVDDLLSLEWLEDARTYSNGHVSQRIEAGKASALARMNNPKKRKPPFNDRSTTVEPPMNDRSTGVLSMSSSLSNSESEGKEKERAKPEPIAMTWPSWAGPNTLAKWEEFKAYRKEQYRIGYKSPRTEQAAVDLLAKYYADGKSCVDGLSLAMGKGWRFPVDPAELGSNGKAPAPPPAPSPIGWQTATGK